MNIEAMGELADKGMPSWVKWMGALLVVVAIVAAIYAYGRQQFGLGEQAENARWLKRENVELTAANAEVLRLTFEKQVQEKAHQERLYGIAAQYQKEKQIEKFKTDALVADLRAGNAGLWYHLASSQGAGAGGSRTPGTATSRGDGGAEAQLPGEIAAALYAEADRADSITRQLGLAQQVIIEDRKLCGK